MSDRRSTLQAIMLIACFCVGAPALPAGQPTSGNPQAPDSPAPAIVREKIEALGLLDNTFPSGQEPSVWLEQRFSTVEPDLIQGLDHKEMRVASECLRILAKKSQSPEFVVALFRIAANPNHPLNAPATLALCAFYNDPRAKVLLEKALPDSSRFPKPEERSRIAEALGRKSEAVRLMVEQIESERNEWERSKWIGRLEDIGDPSAVPALEKLTQVKEWGTAALASLALAKVDPKGHGLTQDQRTFLEEAGRGGKITREDKIKRERDLARLDNAQIRPYVLRMLRSDSPGPALTILAEWKDRQALPEIKRLMSETTVGWRRSGFITAWLTIDFSDATLDEYMSLLERQPKGSSGREDDLRAALQAPLSNDQKLSLLRRAKDTLDKEDPRIIPWVVCREDEQGVLFKALVKEESDVTALAVYAEKAGNDPEKRYGGELRHAVDTLAAAGDIPPAKREGAAMILDACSKQELPGAGPIADRFLGNPDPRIRFAAAHLSAVSGGDRSKALSMLLGSLKDTDGTVRHQASLHLTAIPCLDARERAERESTVLVLVGTPMEDYALRLLPGCEGDETSKRLTPLLDDECTSRAIYAAWVLAQHPDASTREKALRRFAIYAWFKHQVYQQGSGINFTIAPGLSFGQVTSRLNSNAYRSDTRTALTIPPPLLGTFDLDKEEQSFAIRAYRASALDSPDLSPGISLETPFRPREWESSHLPLLETVAREDPYLEVLYVRGEKVADFPSRRAAAQVIAKVTGKPAFYQGLTGERIDSAAFPPKPYQDQDALVARYLLDRIERMGIPNVRPATDAAYRKWDSMSTQVSSLTSTESSGFGKDLRTALRAEAEKRGIAAKLRNAGFAVFLGED